MLLRRGSAGPWRLSSARRRRPCCSAVPAPLTASPRSAALPAGSRVLLLGEGSFTFAAALSQAHPALDVTCSSLETRDDAVRLWGAGPALATLASRGVKTLHGLDATQLHSELGSFARVVFSFPHSGVKGVIQRNRQLLADFSASLNQAQLVQPGGACEVLLAAGQGGTPVDGDALRLFGDSWQLALQAAHGRLILAAATPFDLLAWEALGYASSGSYRGLGRAMPTRTLGFRAQSGVVHTLLPEGSPGAIAPWPLRFAFDVSLWCDDPEAAAAVRLDTPGALDALLQRVRDAAAAIAGEDAVAPAAQCVNAWVRPADGRVSLCVRLTYVAASRALTNEGARDLHEAVRAGLPALLPVAVRTRADALSAMTVG